MADPVDVILLTQDHCKFCDDAKRVLDRVGLDIPLDVATVDLGSAHGQQLAVEGGVMFPPGVFVAGELFSYGRLSERKLRKELSSRRARA